MAEMDVTGTRVADVAWAAAGSPEVAVGTAAGWCACCRARSSSLLPAARVVSRTFTAYDGWSAPSGSGLCAACSWAYRGAGLRRLPQVVHRGGTTEQGLPAVRAALQQPVTGDSCVIVPRRGRKHLVPDAQWGRVCLEDAQLPWGAADGDRLRRATWLIGRGFRPRHLLEVSPPWPVLRQVAPADLPTVLRSWDELAPWRGARPWLDVAIAISTPTREEAAA